MIFLPVRLLLSLAIFAIGSIRPLRTLAIVLAISTGLVMQHRLQENKPLLGDFLPPAASTADTMSAASDLTALIISVADDTGP